MPFFPRKTKMVKKRKTSKAKTLSKPMQLAIAKVVTKIEGKPETKYRADYTVNPDTAIQVFLSMPTDLIPAMPELSEGTASYQRVGQNISNLHGKTHFHIALPYSYSATANWIVRVFMLHPVQSKAETTNVALLPLTLLDKGDGNTTDWDPTVNQVITLSQMPISRENFRGHYKDFRLSKNSGSLNADASTPPPSPNGGHFATYHDFTWHWKHSGTVKYAENSLYPTNYNPVWAIVAYTPDKYPLSKDTPSPVIFTTRNELYYKDA